MGTIGLGIYIPGELGIRHEDTVAVTDSGCENLGPSWSGTPGARGYVRTGLIRNLL